MNVTYYNRPKMKGAFSEEAVFRIIKNELEDKIQIRDYYCRPKWARTYSLLDAFKYQGSVNHITGDVFHLTLGINGKKTILTVHDIGHYERTLTGLKKYIFKFFWYELPLKKARYITTISEFTRLKLLEHTSIDPNKIRVIYNPSPPDFIYHQNSFDQDKPWVLQIGSGSHKNLGRLIEAVDGLDFRLILIRKKDNEIEKDLKKRGIQFQWYENISRQKVYECYKVCDIVFFASEYEGFGVPILEAQAVGRPVITSNIASMPEVAANGALLVDPTSIGEIKEALLRIQQSEELRSRLVDNGRENLKRFSPKKIANDYLKLYHEICNNNG